MWGTIGRRTFLIGTSAALLTAAGLTETGDQPQVVLLPGSADPYGFGTWAAGPI